MCGTEEGRTSYGRTRPGPVARHRSALSLSVFVLITHHSSHDKAPHKLQRIVPGRSSCHRAAPRFRVELIVDTEQSRRTPGPTHTHLRSPKTFIVHLHTNTQVHLNGHH